MTVSAPASRRAPLLLLCTAFFMVVTDSTLVYAALPSLGRQLDLSDSGLQAVVTAYLLTSGGLLLLGGRLADLLHRGRVFLSGCAMFTVMSLLAGLAWNGGVLIGARTGQGVGAAVMVPAALSLLTSTIPEGAERNHALAVWGGLAGIGATTGLLLGGPVTEFLGWRWVFLVNVPVGLLVLLLAPSVLPRQREGLVRTRRLDLGGAVTATLALVALVYAIVAVPQLGAARIRPVAALVVAALLAAAFVRIERRTPDPLVPPHLFRSRTLVGGNLTILAAGVSVDGLLYGFTLLTQDVYGYSASQFGLAAAIMTGVSFVGVGGGQHLVGRLGARFVAVSGLTLVASGSLLLARAATGTGTVPALFAGLLLLGVGIGAAFVAGQIAALGGVAEEDAGLAAGVEESTFTIGNALGVAFLAGIALSRADLAHGLRTGFGAMAAVALLGVLAALLLVHSASGRPRATGFEALARSDVGETR